MFTGRPPHVTGVMFGSRDQYVRDEELLLAEIAQHQRVETGAVMSNGVLGSATNFGPGFDDHIETDTMIPGPVGFRADTVTTAATQWLKRRTPDDLFYGTGRRSVYKSSDPDRTRDLVGVPSLWLTQ